jgi:hypothetical protein
MKRGILSPLTPKSAQSPNLDTVRRSSRKQLKLFPNTKAVHASVDIVPSTGPSSTEIQPVPVSVHSDHLYNAPITKDNVTVSRAIEEETLSLLRQTFSMDIENSDLSQRVMLKTLRWQSFLTSKTAPFASVLCYRGPNQIVESDRLVHDVVCEMAKR